MPSLNEMILIAIIAWTSAVWWKATRAVRASKPYTFSWWDGGAHLRGKDLTTVGTKVQLGCSAILSVGAVLLFFGVLPMREGGFALMIVAAVNIVTGFVCVVKQPKKSRSKARRRISESG